MISDNRLRNLSLLAALAGLIMIFAVVMLSAPIEAKIATIGETDAGKNFVVSGTVMTYDIRDGNIFITLDDGTGKMAIVMFERTARGQTINLKENDNISVEGQVNIYKNGVEIIASSIKMV